jgi:hypothetical protein
MDSPYDYRIACHSENIYIVYCAWNNCINAFRSAAHASALCNMLNAAYQAGQQSKMQERLSEDVYA